MNVCHYRLLQLLHVFCNDCEKARYEDATTVVGEENGDDDEVAMLTLGVVTGEVERRRMLGLAWHGIR